MNKKDHIKSKAEKRLGLAFFGFFLESKNTKSSK